MDTGFYTQDTIKPHAVVRISTENLLSDSVFQNLDKKPAHIRKGDSARVTKTVTVIPEGESITDTTSVCARNSISDVTFYDSLNFIKELKDYKGSPIPFQFAENSKSALKEFKPALIMDLKQGIPLPEKPVHSDWIVVIMFFIAYLYLLVRSTTKKMFPEITKYFLFRANSDSLSHEITSLYTWQSTILNLISFSIIGLFVYCVAEWYDLIPTGLNPVLAVLISFGIVFAVVSLRHLITSWVGNLSGKTEIFNEYIVTIYQSYKFGSLFIFIIVLLLVYSVYIPKQPCIIAGFAVLGIFYLYRILRLLFIFLNRGVSILYLILYLCALEILPVLILVRYLTVSA